MWKLLIYSGMVLWGLIGVLLLILIHKIMIGFTPYRYLVNCVTYPLQKRFVRRKTRSFGKALRETKHVDRKAVVDYVIKSSGWKQKFWFGKRLQAVVIDEINKIYDVKK